MLGMPTNKIHFCPSREPSARPATDLIKHSTEPEPKEEDMFNKDVARPPRFKTHIKPQIELKEAGPGYFECRLLPIGDPDMKLEWFKDGVALTHGKILV